jgi:zinc protease
MAGPLFNRIREQLGLAYHVSAMLLPGLDAGAFIFHLATAPEHIATAEAALRDEIHQLATRGLAADELDRCRNSALSSLALCAQDPGTLARQAATDTILGLGPRHTLELPALYHQVRPDHVRTAAARWFATEPVVARVLPETA